MGSITGHGLMVSYRDRCRMVLMRRVTALTGADGMTALPSDCWGYSCACSGLKITGADIGIYSIYSIVKIKIYCI